MRTVSTADALAWEDTEEHTVVIHRDDVPRRRRARSAEARTSLERTSSGSPGAVLASSRTLCSVG